MGRPGNFEICPGHCISHREVNDGLAYKPYWSPLIHAEFGNLMRHRTFNLKAPYYHSDSRPLGLCPSCLVACLGSAGAVQNQPLKVGFFQSWEGFPWKLMQPLTALTFLRIVCKAQGKGTLLQSWPTHSSPATTSICAESMGEKKVLRSPVVCETFCHEGCEGRSSYREQDYKGTIWKWAVRKISDVSIVWVWSASQ